MENYSFEEKMFLKNLANEFGATTNEMRCKTYSYSRRVRSAAYSNRLREFVTQIRYDIKDCSANILQMINNYKSFYNEPDISNKEAFEKLIDKINKFRIEVLKYDNNYVNMDTPFDSVLTFAKNLIKTSDKIIEFDNLAHKVEETEDTKFNTTTAENIIKDAIGDDGYTSKFDSELQKIENEFKSKNVDMFSADYWKMCSKRLRAFKAEVYSIVNKYFGQSSKLGEFHLMDQLV
jgi:hypothetical protein